MAKLRLMFSACALEVSNWSYDVLCMWEWTSDTIWLLDILSNWSLKPKTSQGVTPTLSPKHLDTGRSTPMPVSPQLAVPRCSRRFPFCGPALVQSDGWITHGYPGTSTVCHGKLAMCRRFIPYLYHIYTILNYRQYHIDQHTVDSGNQHLTSAKSCQVSHPPQAPAELCLIHMHCMETLKQSWISRIKKRMRKLMTQFSIRMARHILTCRSRSSSVETQEGPLAKTR